ARGRLLMPAGSGLLASVRAEASGRYVTGMISVARSQAHAADEPVVLPLSVGHADADIAAVAALLADPTRAAMLLSLMDGRMRPASELARLAKVSPATASEHLAKLVAGEMVAVAP